MTDSNGDDLVVPELSSIRAYHYEFVQIHRGGRLVATRGYGSGAGDDVTAAAHVFMFRQTSIEDGATLMDLVKLVEQSEVLQSVLYLPGHWAEFLDAARHCGSGPEPTQEATDLEYMELVRRWNYNSRTATYEDVDRLDPVLMGRLVTDPAVAAEWSIGVGERIQFSTEGATIWTTAHLPVRIRADVGVHEGDRESSKAYRELHRVRVPFAPLGSILHAAVGMLAWWDPATLEEAGDESDEAGDELE
jgi:hypothetical protein